LTKAEAPEARPNRAVATATERIFLQRGVKRKKCILVEKKRTKTRGR